MVKNTYCASLPGACPSKTTSIRSRAALAPPAANRRSAGVASGGGAGAMRRAAAVSAKIAGRSGDRRVRGVGGKMVFLARLPLL